MTKTLLTLTFYITFIFNIMAENNKINENTLLLELK